MRWLFTTLQLAMKLFLANFLAGYNFTPEKAGRLFEVGFHFADRSDLNFGVGIASNTRSLRLPNVVQKLTNSSLYDLAAFRDY